MFDKLQALAPHKPVKFRDELNAYLNSDTEDVDNVLLWWVENRKVYPRLSRMALDYLSIPHAYF